MKNIFVVTHTQSRHHIEKKVGGWYDTELTEQGRADAKATAERVFTLASGAPVEIFSSDLLRTSQTAGMIAERFQCRFMLTRALREISFGSAEGQPQEWLNARQTSAPDDNRLDHQGGIPDAETRRDVAKRVFRCVEMIINRPCETQIIVTHGFALTFVIAAWIKMPLDACGHVAFPAHPGSITHLQQDDDWRSRAVLTLADTSHLIKH